MSFTIAAVAYGKTRT